LLVATLNLEVASSLLLSLYTLGQRFKATSRYITHTYVHTHATLNNEPWTRKIFKCY